MQAYIGEVKLFPVNQIPNNWAFCDGTILQNQQANALFSVIGYQFGGNKTTTFALPDLRGRAPIGDSVDYLLGTAGGANGAILVEANVPIHTHNLLVSNDIADGPTPLNNVLATTTDVQYGVSTDKNVNMSAEAISPNMGNMPLNTIQPSVGMVYCIAMSGYFPSRA